MLTMIRNWFLNPRKSFPDRDNSSSPIRQGSLFFFNLSIRILYYLFYTLMYFFETFNICSCDLKSGNFFPADSLIL